MISAEGYSIKYEFVSWNIYLLGRGLQINECVFWSGKLTAWADGGKVLHFYVCLEKYVTLDETGR